MTIEMLEIVDENDVVMGTAPRTEIHAKGLLHREVNIFFITPSGEVIFQRRSKTKDTFPDLLDATAGGHVEIGDSYDQTAIKEIAEETGLTVDEGRLFAIKKDHCDMSDPVTGTRNNCFRMVYGYVFDGTADQLQIEDNAAQGFEAFPVQSMLDLPDHVKKQFVGRFVEPERSHDVYQRLLTAIQ